MINIILYIVLVITLVLYFALICFIWYKVFTYNPVPVSSVSKSAVEDFQRKADEFVLELNNWVTEINKRIKDKDEFIA